VGPEDAVAFVSDELPLRIELQFFGFFFPSDKQYLCRRAADANVFCS
jgi:hypothetical protein